MTLEPHPEILEFWRAAARFSFREGAFVWSGRGDSLGDAEQLLCILHPATQHPRYRLDLPGRAEKDALDALGSIGDRYSVPLRLIRAQTAYLMRYRDAEGFPTFAIGDGPDCVESLAIGLRLSLAALGFSRVYRSEVSDAGAVAEAQRLEELATIRLSAAMVGLVRGFAVVAYDDDSADGRTLHGLLGQEHRDLGAVLTEYRSVMAEIRARLLEDVTIGSVAPAEARHLPYIACGWASAPTLDAAEIEIDDGDRVAQRPGTAAPAPDLYYTWVALDAIGELTTPRTRLLGLLTEDQSRVAQSLQLRLELARFHWARLAMFGDHRWPVEQLPWAGPGGQGDYASLLVTTIAAAELGASTGNNDLGFAYLLRVFARLAARHGIVRPPHAAGSPAVVAMDGHRLADGHRAADFAAVLFDGLLRAATETSNQQLRGELTDLAALVWEHIGRGEQHSWRDARRLVAAMTTAVDLADGLGRTGPPLGFVHQLLADADAAFESLPEPERAPLAPRLDRARRIVDQHPARAAALLYQVLGALDDRL
jgi:hypothetical protein